MMRKPLLLLLTLLLSFTLFSQSSPTSDNTTLRLLSAHWIAVSAADSLGNAVNIPPGQAHLNLKGDSGLFEQKFTEASPAYTGQWALHQKNLILNYDPTTIPDSLPKIDSRKYDIAAIANDTLKLVADGTTIVYLREKHVVASVVKRGGGMTVTTLLRGLLGMIVLIFLAWLFSSNRKAVSWRVVGVGLLIQISIALGILFIPFIEDFFGIVGSIFVVILDFTKIGSTFLFNDLMDIPKAGYIFALQILPTIIFFSALTSVLFYLGIIQKVVWVMAWLMTKALRISGAESLSVAGNIFLGQTESPLMIKAYLPKMNDSEMLLVMIGGMATVAGGVMAAYISFLGGDDPEQRLMYARHLLTASVMAAPGAIVMSKILMPQTESVDMKVEVTQEKIGKNFLDALSNGTTEGLKLAANVGAMLLVFFAFIAMMNFILLKIGVWTNLNVSIAALTSGQYTELSMEFILGYTFAPLMWIIGVGPQDITLVGQLLGEKLIASEFVGYTSLASMKETGLFTDQKSVIMATYMLCGFANFASIGIQIGGIGGLAPNKRWFLSKYGMKALIGGTLASLLSATIIGAIIG
ncbi:MAG: nucleoside transporter C-terminal domain-containing protein [Bacteroidales bacterium]|nr:nucleoside transporter C-terminal domain-containing protein [Bacteroidales bacterium]